MGELEANVARLGILVATCLGSWTIANLVRKSSNSLGLTQHPNSRSSHSTPTPSGGGVAIAVASIVASLANVWAADIRVHVILLASAIAGLLGLLDDRYDLSAVVRLVVQALLVSTLVTVFVYHAPSQSGLYLLYVPTMTVLGVWWINLFNFMDGIDGMAGSEGIFLALGMLVLGIGGGELDGGRWIAWWAASLCSATFGFLLLNWAPAKIFMGDAGSNFLAVAIFALALDATSEGWLSHSAVAVLGASFVADATLTLFKRALSGQKWLAGHRLHAYQKLSRRLGSHHSATLTYIAINLLWLYPLACLCEAFPSYCWAFLLAAYGPLLALFQYLGAGEIEDSGPAAPTGP